MAACMQGGRRLDHIHGLRGLAALAVVIQHSTQLVQDAGVGWYHPLLATINLGRFGVILFFLISGLVVPFSFRGETPLRHFAISRAFRLFPAYWLSIPVLGCIAVLEYGQDLGFGRVLANATMLQGLLGQRDIGPGYWTLRFEAIFYLLTALLFWRRLLSDAALNGVFVLACLMVTIEPVVAGLLFGHPGPIPLDPYMLAMFFLGMLLRRHFVDLCPVARRWSLALVPAAMITGLAVSGFVFRLPENANPYLAPLPMATGMVLPVAVFVLVLWRRPAAPRWAMYLGTVSYSVYLFQDVGLIGLRHLVPPGQWPIGYVAAVIALTLGIATVVHRTIEKPMIALGKRFAETRPAATVAFPN